MRIIVVEDEQRSREGLCRLLQSLQGKHELIACASNGQVALDQILQMKPDVVFTDIKMPVMDGMSLIAAVRAHGMNTEFIVISGFADFEFARRSISLGVTEYLLKPVTQEEVENALAKVQNRLGGIVSGRSSRGGLREKYPGAHPAVLRALDIIENGYAGKISQRDLADELEISAEYFSYLFSKEIGMTFSEFLRRFRIDKAKELYASRSCPRQEVPYAVGYSDAKYFAQVFRAVTGESPAEYLRQRTL